MKTPKLLTFISIITIIGCRSYPSTKQLQREYLKNDKELVSKLNPDPLPEELKENETEGIYLKTGWYFVTDSTKGILREVIINSKTESIYLDTIALLTPKDIELFYLTNDSREKDVVNLIMYFDEAGTEKWSVITEKSISEKLAFVINNKIEMTPTVNNQITSGVFVLWGNKYTPGEMIAIKKLLISQKESKK